MKKIIITLIIASLGGLYGCSKTDIPKEAVNSQSVQEPSSNDKQDVVDTSLTEVGSVATAKKSKGSSMGDIIDSSKSTNERLLIIENDNRDTIEGYFVSDENLYDLLIEPDCIDRDNRLFIIAGMNKAMRAKSTISTNGSVYKSSIIANDYNTPTHRYDYLDGYTEDGYKDGKKMFKHIQEEGLEFTETTYTVAESNKLRVDVVSENGLNFSVYADTKDTIYVEMNGTKVQTWSSILGPYSTDANPRMKQGFIMLEEYSNSKVNISEVLYAINIIMGELPGYFLY